MRTARPHSSATLHFERLEERLPMSASLASLEPMALPTLNSAKKKPVGYSYPIGMTPDMVRTAYGFDNVSFNGIVGDGTGQTIAIVTAYHNPNIVSDLATFDQTFGLPAPPSFRIVNQYGGTKLPKKNKNWGSETALDVEWAHAIAPGASILLVEAKNASNFGAAIDYARHVPGVSVISVSAAGDEYKDETFADELFTTPPAHTGETFVFAAGDDGTGALYPSSSPNVLSVGGTSLYTYGNGQWYGETVWSGGGGGMSKYEGVPSYQNGLGLSSRGTPDVAYNGDPETGFAVYDSYGFSGWVQFGGTSAGTPQWAGLLAIANQGRALAGKGSLANAQAVIYAMPSSDFHDITYGSNGISATAGYDLATGRGSPIADRLIPDLVAYNGSTDFTVTPLPSAPTKKSSKQSAFYPLSPADSQVVTGLPFADSAVATHYQLISGNIATKLGTANQNLSARTLLGSSRSSAASTTADSDAIDSALENHGTTSDSAPSLRKLRAKSSVTLITVLNADSATIAGIDTYFAALARAAA